MKALNKHKFSLISPQSMTIKLRTRLLKVREKISNEICCELLSNYCLVTKRLVGSCEMITYLFSKSKPPFRDVEFSSERYVQLQLDFYAILDRRVVS